MQIHILLRVGYLHQTTKVGKRAKKQSARVLQKALNSRFIYMSYRCLAKQEFTSSSYLIRPLLQEEMGFIKEWRNAQMKVLRQKTPLTDLDQKSYWSRTIQPSFKAEKPEQILFAFLRKEVFRARKGITSSFGLCETKPNRLERGTPFPCGTGDEEGRFGEVAASPNEEVIPLRALIGYGGLTHIDWEAERAEMSFLLDPSRTASQKGYEEDFSTFITLIQKVAFEELRLHRLFTETFAIRPLHVAVLERSGFSLEGRLKDHVKIEGKYEDSLIHGYIAK